MKLFLNFVMRRFAAGIAVVSTITSLPAEQRIHRDDVLGTSFDLTVISGSAGIAEKAAKAALDEVSRLETIVSTYRDDSEISKLNKLNSLIVSPELITVLQAAETWRIKTDGAFSGRMGKLLERWQLAAATQELPDRPKLRVLAGEIRDGAVEIDRDTRQVIRPDAVVWAVDGVAKGYIIDRAFDAARSAAPSATGMMLNIGGDIRFDGSPANSDTWSINIASPEAPQDNAAPLMTLELHAGAVATSGFSPRNYSIAGESYSHILDAQSGWPSKRNVAVSVWAPDAGTADALATAFMSMPIQKGLNLVEKITDTEALIITADGRHIASSGWRQWVTHSTSDTASPSPFTLEIDYEIPQLDVARYRAPYLAIWITDEKRQLVRGLGMLGDSLRWQEENYVWWRRYGRKVPMLVDALSQPSRRPGHYRLQWDGVDDFGQPVAPGTYTLNIEAAREFGEHTILRWDLDLQGPAFVEERSAEGEIGAVRAAFRPHPPRP